MQFFQGSHDPRICWQGSGYTFQEVKIENIAGKEVYTALLEKGQDRIYTAWWFQNESARTVHEWEWRRQTLQANGGYYLVNVSCENRIQLEHWVAEELFR